MHGSKNRAVALLIGGVVASLLLTGCVADVPQSPGSTDTPAIPAIPDGSYRSLNEAEALVISAHEHDESEYAVPPLTTSGQIRDDFNDVVIWNEIALASNPDFEHVYGRRAGTSMSYRLYVTDMPSSEQGKAELLDDAFGLLEASYGNIQFEGSSSDEVGESWCISLMDADDWEPEQPTNKSVAIDHSGIGDYLMSVKAQANGVCAAPDQLGAVAFYME